MPNFKRSAAEMQQYQKNFEAYMWAEEQKLQLMRKQEQLIKDSATAQILDGALDTDDY